MGTIANLAVQLSMNAADFERGVGSALASTESLSNKLGNVGRTMTMGVTAPLVGAGAAAIKFATDLNAGMANTQSLGLTAERVAQLKGNIQEMAVTVGKDTADLADGLYQVVSAFGDTADTAAILEINAKAAAAGLATTTDAINLTSAVTKGFGDTSADAVQKTSDLAFVAVKLGQTTFPELAASMGRVVPIAASLGVKQEELFGVMATATGVTGSAAEVSTQLRGVLQSLMAPTESMSQLIGSLGYETGAALLQQEGMQGAIEKIVAAADAAGAPLQSYIGSIEGQTLALALAGPQADVFTEKLAAMQDVAGASDAAFAAQTQGINAAGFAMQKLSIKAQVVAQKVGDGLAPALGVVLDRLTPVVDWVVSLADGFAKLDANTQMMIVAGLGLAAALGPVLTLLPMLATAVGVLASPVGLVIGAVALLGVAWATNFGGIRDATMAAWATIQQVLGGLPAYVDRILKSAQSGSFDWGTLIPDLDWNAFVTNLSSWGQYVAGLAWSTFVSALDWASGFVASLDWGSFVATLSDWGQYVADLAWDGLVALLTWDMFISQLAWSSFVTALDWATGFVTSLDWGAFVGQLGEWSQYVGSLTWSTFVTALDWASGFVTSLDWGTFVGQLGEWSQYVGSLTWSTFVTALDWASGFVTSLDWGTFVGQLGEWSQYVGGLTWSTFVTALDWASGFVTSLDWGAFVTALSDWGQYVTTLDWLTYAGGFTWDQVLTVLPWADYVPALDMTTVSTAFDGVSTSMGAVSTAWESVQGIVDKIGEVMAPAFERLQAAVGALPEKFGELAPQLAGLSEAFSGLTTALQPVLNLLGMLAGALGVGLVVAANLGVNLLAAAFERLPQLLAPIIDQVTATINLISSTLTGVTTAITAMSTGDWSTAWNALKGIVDGVIAYVTESWNNFTAMFKELGSLFTAIVPPGWFEKLTGWEWPPFTPPALLSSLLTWAWPDFSAIPDIVGTLLGWHWPTLNMPDWLDGLLDFEWPGFPALPWWLGGEGDGAGQNAGGTNFWRGGLTWVGERGPELISLPRGTKVYPSDLSMQMAGEMAQAGVQITVNATVANELDLQQLAYQLATEFERWRR